MNRLFAFTMVLAGAATLGRTLCMVLNGTPGGEFTVEPGLWIQADANGVLPSEVKTPKGSGSSRFFRVKVTDNPGFKCQAIIAECRILI